MKVENMTSAKGNKIANQFEIFGDMYIDGSMKTGTLFQSYQSAIVFRTHLKTYIDQYYWDYSVTTGKYRNLFLGECKAETQKKIDSGEYILTDLNG